MDGPTARLVHDARDQFLADGYLERRFAHVVRPEILVSWRRSRLSGASTSVDALPYQAEVNTGSALCRAAEPVLSRLAQQLSGLQAGVLVADRNARILRRWAPETSILPMMDRIQSDSGSSGSEELVGTNGIGSIVEDRRPHLVVGPEHFAEVLVGFSCVGAPIFNPLSRKFEGVVTLNSDATEASPLLTSLIATTAQEIESRLLDQSSRRERALLDAFLMATRAGRAIAVLGDEVLLAGAQVSPVLRSLDHRDIWEQIREGAASNRSDRPVSLVMPHDSGSFTYTPIRLDDKLVGALLEVGTPQPATVRSVTPLRVVPQRWAAGEARLPGSSSIWSAVRQRAAEQRDLDVPLLLLGEAGTGKLELAKAMFDDRPHTVIDCLAVAADDVGWPRTIAETVPPAGPSVIILRHVDSLSPAVAAALSVHVETLARERPELHVVATALPATAWVDDGNRRRLHDRLGVVTIDLPPLRDRAEDIPELVRQLNDRYAGLTPLRFTHGALHALTRAPWPGNVRQLENVVRGLAATGHAHEITPDLLPEGLGAFATGRSLTRMEQLEMNAIMEMVTATRGNKVEMAKQLGISRSTLYRKMRHYRVDLETSGV
jgi:transcriptional regulator of acetoin/glycerol metabolism